MTRKHSKLLLFTLFVSAMILFHIHPGFAEEKKEQEAPPKYISIDFDNVDIRVFIKFISDLSNKNFVIDNRVKGNVSIISPGKITVKEAYKVFESVLEVHGFTTVKSGEITKIIPAPTARSKNVETKLNKSSEAAEDKIVTQLIPLKYADVNELKKLFAPLVSKGSVILSYPPTNTMIITDFYSNIKRLMSIIEVIDIQNVGRQISIIPIKHANAGKLAKTMNTLFKAKSAGGGKPQPDELTRFVADERTNTIIMLANEFDTQKAKEIIHTMDKQAPKSDAKIRVYYLENANAEELAAVLQTHTGKVKQKKQGKKIAPVVSDKVRITADKATNSLIIMADKEDYSILESIIKKLDIPRPMVYIEALIMEIRNTEDFKLGVEWSAATSAGDIDGRDAGVYGGFTKDSDGGVNALPSIESNAALGIPGGFAMGIMGEVIKIGDVTFPNLGAAIRAVKNNEKVNIISTPQIMTTDNEEAEISVGENVPYKTQSGSGDQVYESFEYKDVGVTLKITPQISQERFVRLNIDQTVEKLSSTDDDTPTTLKRTAKTTVVIKDASTVVIGGLIGKDLNQSDYKIPCLGDIPLAGNLFKSTSKSGIQTNLYIFLTPNIIQNPAEAEKIYEKKSKEINEVQEKTIQLFKDQYDQQQNR